MDRRAAARAIEDFLRALGHEPTGELEGTGERVADAWADDLLEGESIDAAALLVEGSIENVGRDPGVVVLRDLSVTTVCPHHLLPAMGTGTVAYFPGARLAGIGTIAHVLDVLARRLTLQERIGADLTALIVHELGARGAVCRLALTHTCLAARGERKVGAVVETIAFAGTCAHEGADRALGLSAIGRG